MEYGNIAYHIAAGDGFAIRYNHWWPADPVCHKTRWMMPFYPLLLAVSKHYSPLSYTYVYVVQSLAAGAVAYCVFRLAAGIYGLRAGLFATALFAGYPSFVYTCAVPFPVCWELAAVVLALWACHAHLAGRRWPTLVGCALATLWALYIRSAWILLVPIVAALWWLADGGWRRHRRSIVAYGAIVAVGVSPWLARNWLAFGSPSLGNLDFPLWEGHNAGGHPTGYGPGGIKLAHPINEPELWKAINAARPHGEAAILREFRKAALQAIAQRPFHQLVVLPAQRTLYFLTWDPNHPRSRYWLLYRLPYLVLLATALAGLVWSWRRPGVAWRFGLGCVAAVWLALWVKVVVFHYLPRFRMPAELVLMLPAGYLLDRVAAALTGRRSARP